VGGCYINSLLSHNDDRRVFTMTTDNVFPGTK
jgi:hypothetical protein